VRRRPSRQWGNTTPLVDVRATEREFQYGEWLRDDYEAGLIPGPQIDHDVAPLLATALTASIALVGPPARAVFGPIPHQHLVASMREAIPSLIAELDSDTTNVLLTLARMWHTTDTGLVVTKDTAASWALERIPAELRPPLTHASAVYIGEEDESYDRLPIRAVSTARHMRTIIRNRGSRRLHLDDCVL